MPGDDHVYRVCTGPCQRELPATTEHFSPDVRRPHGVRSLCRACTATRQAEARQARAAHGGRVNAPRGASATDPDAVARYLRSLDALALERELARGHVQEWEATCMLCGDLWSLVRVPTPTPLVTRLGDMRCRRNCGGAAALMLRRGPVAA